MLITCNEYLLLGLEFYYSIPHYIHNAIDNNYGKETLSHHVGMYIFCKVSIFHCQEYNKHTRKATFLKNILKLFIKTCFQL